MNFGVAIFPSKKLQDLVNSYRKRYDPHYALIAPHITLKSGFQGSESQVGEITQRLKEIASQYQPFPLKVLKVSTFQPINNVIYLKVEPSAELVGLHEAMYSGYFIDVPPFKFVPHLTIGQKLSDDEHSDVIGQMKMMNFEHKEIVDRFHLLYQLDNGSWTVYETYNLGLAVDNKE